MTDKDRLIELIKQCYEKFRKSDETYIEPYLADYLLANDVVKVVRCKDCTYLRESDMTNKMFCTYHGDYHEVETFPNDYCSNGVGLVKGV